MKRQPTQAQKERAAARRAQFKELAKRVAAMSDAERAEIIERVGSIPTVEGRALSVFNACLILTQCPSASLVGGFRQWANAGRHVRKGEHGMMIWIPCGKSRATDAPVAADLVDGDSKRPRFIMGTVFDVSQTDAGSFAAVEAERELVEV